MMSILHQQHADPWSTELLDLASLNAHVSDTVLAAIDAIRGAALDGGADLQSRSFLVLGPAGAGKTHLFARLRRSAGARGAFVLLRPELAVEPTPRHVLAHAVDALRRPVPGQKELGQLDVVVGSAVSVLDGAGARWPAVALDQLRTASGSERQDALEHAVEVIERSHPEIEPDWLARFLALPFASGPDRRAAFQWLSGREPDHLQLERLGFREPLPEASVLPALRTLAAVASFSAPLVVVFDQLENLIQERGATGGIHAHARLLCELHDTVPGLILVQLSLDSEWQQRISPALSLPEKSRLEARVLTLALPTPGQRAELVEAWLAQLAPEGRRPLPWPFTSEGWQRWQNQPGVTPRMLMIAATEALEHGVEIELPPPAAAEAPATEPIPIPTRPRTRAQDGHGESLEDLWDGQLALARAAIDEAASAGRPVDGDRIASGIAAALRLFGVEFEVAGAKQPHQLRVESGDLAADLFVVQKAHPRSVAVQLERAADAARSRPVVAMREAARPFPPSWRQVAAHLGSLLAQPHARWLDLARDDIARLLALHDLLAAARSQDLPGVDGRPIAEADARSWARERLGIRDWKAIAALLGTRSGRSGRDGDAGRRQLPPAPLSRASGPVPARDPVTAAIRRLRLASIDRILREARAVDPELLLSTVLERLRALASRLRWFGRSIVWWDDEGER